MRASICNFKSLIERGDLSFEYDMVNFSCARVAVFVAVFVRYGRFDFHPSYAVSTIGVF